MSKWGWETGREQQGGEQPGTGRSLVRCNTCRDKFSMKMVLSTAGNTNSFHVRSSSGVYRASRPQRACLDLVVDRVSHRGAGQVEMEDSRFYKRPPCIDRAAGTPCTFYFGPAWGTSRAAAPEHIPLSVFYPTAKGCTGTTSNAFASTCS